MIFWVGLFEPKAQEAIVEGANVMLAIAHKLLAQQKRHEQPGAFPAPQEGAPEDEDHVISWDRSAVFVLG
jgi:hypothetical protein